MWELGSPLTQRLRIQVNGICWYSLIKEKIFVNRMPPTPLIWSLETWTMESLAHDKYNFSEIMGMVLVLFSWLPTNSAITCWIFSLSVRCLWTWSKSRWFILSWPILLRKAVFNLFRALKDQLYYNKKNNINCININ